MNPANRDRIGKGYLWSHAKRIAGGSPSVKTGAMARGGQSGRARSQHPFGIRRLEGIVKKSDEEIVTIIMTEKENIQKLFETKLTGNLLVLLVKMFAKAVKISYLQNKVNVILLFSKEEFTKKLQEFIIMLPVNKTKDAQQRNCTLYWDNESDFFEDLHTIFTEIVKNTFSTAAGFMPGLIPAINYTIKNLQWNTNGETEVKDRFVKFETDLNLLMQKKNDSKKTAAINSLSPPDDFRAINLYPQMYEVRDPDYWPFLRKNIVEGQFASIDDYLDIQFRLLREDFISPLRKALCSYLSKDNANLKRQHDVRVYVSVKYLGLYKNKNITGHLLRVCKPGSIKNIEYTKRYMFGSLVGITTDNFTSISFGTIVDRNLKLLRKGQIVVEFVEKIVLDTAINYTLLESSIYFEPYYQVLKGLQLMPTDTFPMEKYFVKVDTDIASTNYKINYDCMDSMNEKQRTAYINAMQRELAIIQGPPGTGKTWLGLIIAKSLLRLSTTPILVICYTNHALDQFLEGLMDSTQNILRVGSQSKNENLNKFNIKNKRGNFKLPSALYKERNRLRLEVLEKERKLQMYYDEYSFIELKKGIISANRLAELYGSLKFTRLCLSEKNFVSWLLADLNISSRTLQVILSNSKKILQQESDEDSESDSLQVDDDLYQDRKRFITSEQISLKFLQEQIIENDLKKTSIANYSDDGESKELQDVINYIQTNLHRKINHVNIEEYIQNINNLKARNRWELYISLVNIHKAKLLHQLNQFNNKYRAACTLYKELCCMGDLQMMKESRVVGMTTTGAARLQPTLQMLKCKAVIVEEAAEVLESHIITPLTRDCKHLILIGDHKQLRPSTADYRMDKKFMLGISFFERMILNKMPFDVLDVQHRMRPEIARLITPSIYPNLINHDSVQLFPPIAGVLKSLYFVDHNHPEFKDDSVENAYEVHYLLQLAQYLIFNKYSPEQITIIAAYKAQMFKFMNCTKENPLLKGVKIVVLDNYQGEENDIILLSLVRNNSEDKIGFLSLENRVCVALSRARYGLYMMGNMGLYCRNSEVWPKVKQALEHGDCIGRLLPLRCTAHNEVTFIGTLEDFKNVSDGGCSRECAELKDCGHTCLSKCHGLSHDDISCMQPCLHLCSFGHKCHRVCSEPCGFCEHPVEKLLPCGHTKPIPCYMHPDDYKCEESVKKELLCGHNAATLCYIDPMDIRCTVKCIGRIEPCGHACGRKCHVFDDPNHIRYKCPKPCVNPSRNCTADEKHICPRPCWKPCTDCDILVKKRCKCLFIYSMKCSEEIENCSKRCTQILDCGHVCKYKCSEPCDGYCMEMVSKVVAGCGHKVQMECYKQPTRCNCTEKCERKLECGHDCTLKCDENCADSVCRVYVKSNLQNPWCDHRLWLPCYLSDGDGYRNLEEYYGKCMEKCCEMLKCGHSCGGTCGGCFQGRIHEPCTSKCSNILVCGHSCKVKCRLDCQACTMRCEYKCEHSKCLKRCGNPCTECHERCSRKCEHVECTNRCGQKCTVDACTAPCQKKLQCGHKCIGFCGDVCPPLCRICNEDEVTEMFFGTEDQEDARFVYLVDCNHTIESSGLEGWLREKVNSDEICHLSCPKCKSRISSNNRYKHYILTNNLNIQRVKRKYFSIVDAETINALINKCNILQSKCKTLNLQWTVHSIKDRLTKKCTTQTATTYNAVIEFITEIFKILVTYEGNPVHLKWIRNHIDATFCGFDQFCNKKCMSDQNTEDYSREVQRLQRIVQFYNYAYENEDLAKTLEEYQGCESILLSHRLYSEDVDKSLEEKLKEFARKLNCTIEECVKVRRIVVQAIGLSKGHWFKCRNGHVYAIGECGGAMEQSLCPECKEVIGGNNHRLADGNFLAPEMDGAQHPAYSDTANMLNYRL